MTLKFSSLSLLLSFLRVCLSQNYSSLLSSVECKTKPGYEPVNRLCIFRNLYFKKDFYFVDETGDTKIDSLYIANRDIYSLWKPAVISINSAISQNITKIETAPFSKVIYWGRLAPYNWYHHLYEDYQQILKIREEKENISYDVVSDHQLLFDDSNYDQFLHTWSWFFHPRPLHVSDLIQLYPEGIRFPYLMAGTERECGNREHCKHNSGSRPVLEFRKAVFGKFGMSLPMPVKDSGNDTIIQVIQRKGSRKFLDLELNLRNVHYRTKINYLEDASPISQAQLFSSSTAYFLMNGAVQANWLFLKPGALIIETRPYHHYHNLTEWMMENLCPLNITIVSFFFNYTDAVPRMNELRKVYFWKKLSKAEKEEFEQTHNCHRQVCYDMLYYGSDWKMSSTVMNALFDYAIGTLQVPAMNCQHFNVQYDAENKKIVPKLDVYT